MCGVIAKRPDMQDFFNHILHTLPPWVTYVAALHQARPVSISSMADVDPHIGQLVVFALGKAEMDTVEAADRESIAGGSSNAPANLGRT